jgi:DnaJ-class molecular chaperone
MKQRTYKIETEAICRNCQGGGQKLGKVCAICEGGGQVTVKKVVTITILPLNENIVKPNNNKDE